MLNAIRSLLSNVYDFSSKEESLDIIENKTVDEQIRKGTITFTASNSAEIDNAYVFAFKTDYLKVGDKVKYKITNVMGNVEVSDVVLDVDIKTTQGVIKSVDDDLYTFEPGNIQFYLYAVKINFIPSQGDYVTLQLENDQIVSVSATENPTFSGNITYYDDATDKGFIENTIIFSLADCIDFNPKKNIHVTCRTLKNQFGERAIDIYMVKKKHTLDVTHVPIFTVKLGGRKDIEIKVTNFTRVLVEIISCKLISKTANLILSPKSSYIGPGKSVTYVILCHGNKIGKNEARLELIFDSLKIVRNIKYNTIDMSNNNTIVIPGEKKFLVPNYVNVKMKEYTLPSEILKICCSDTMSAIKDLSDLHPCLKENLNKHNYINKLHCLLFIEEAQHVLVAKSLTNNFPLYFYKNMHYFEFNTDLLYSNLFIGDTVLVSKAWETGNKFSGKIFDIIGNQVFMKLNYLFMNDYKECALYKLEFIRSRTTMRKAHFALDIINKHNLLNRVYPEKPIRQSKLNQTIKWVNKSLNDEQKNAVQNILSKNSSQPYVIWGPPGTGKTVTVVELVLQLSQMKNTRIMVVAPTNSAIDLIGVKLFEAGLTSKNMVRLCSYGAYTQGHIPICLSDMTFTPSLFDEAPINTDENVPIITQKKLGKHKITLGTMQCVGTLCSLGLPGGHFSHIIVDEAGQATEPELLIPMSFLDAEYSQFILAGDPNQLGPVVSSKVAEKLGLKQSFLSRMMTLRPYKRDTSKYDCLGYDQRVATKLIRNYRALPELVKMTSDMFYDGDLIAMINEASPEFDLLSKIKINNAHINQSMICINTEGPELQPKDSFSFCNNHEIMKILIILSEMYRVMSPDQIGIITPYRLQSKMLTQRLESLNMFAPKIGSVEEFQGSERDVIIFSTVRSSKNLSQCLPEFIKEKTKINVALSRAKVLNIIVGNKAYLQTDPMWKLILNYCQ